MPSTQTVVLAELKACLSPEFWIRGERMVDFVHAALGDRLSQDAVRVKLHGNGKRGKGSGMIAISPLQSQGIDRKRAEGEKVNWYWGPLTSSGSAPSVGCNEYNSLHEYIGGQPKMAGVSIVSQMVVSAIAKKVLPACWDSKEAERIWSELLSEADRPDLQVPGSHLQTIMGQSYKVFVDSVRPEMKGRGAGRPIDRRGNREKVAERLLLGHSCGAFTVPGLETGGPHRREGPTAAAAATGVPVAALVATPAARRGRSMGRSAAASTPQPPASAAPSRKRDTDESRPQTTVSKRQRNVGGAHVSSPASTPRQNRSEPHRHQFEVAFQKYEVMLELNLFEPVPRIGREPEQHTEGMLRAAIAALVPGLQEFHTHWSPVTSKDVEQLLYTWANKEKNFRGVMKRLRLAKSGAADDSRFWWEFYIGECVREVNPEMQLLGSIGRRSDLRGAVGQHKGYAILMQNVTFEKRREVETRGKLAKETWIQIGAFAMARAQQLELRKTAGARMVTSGVSGRGRDKGRKHQQDHANKKVRAGKKDAVDKKGRKLGPKLAVDLPSRHAVLQHKADMKKAGVTSGRYIHRNKTTGRCVLVDQKIALDGCKVIGRAPHKEEWIPLLLRSEEKLHRLKVSLRAAVSPPLLTKCSVPFFVLPPFSHHSFTTQKEKAYDIQVVWGGDEMPSGAHPIGNCCLVLVSDEIFKRGTSRPFPAILWNGPEEWALEVYEAVIRDEWGLKTSFTLSKPFTMNANVRLLSTDNKLNATFHGQQKGSANHRTWMLGPAPDGFGLHIRDVNDVSKFKPSSMRGKVDEYLEVLHRTASSMLKSLNLGKYHGMSKDELKEQCKSRTLHRSGNVEVLIGRLEAVDPPQPATLATLAAAVEVDMPEKDIQDRFSVEKSKQGVEWFPCGLADNPRALHDAHAYVSLKFGKGNESAAYFEILLQLDRRVNKKHALLHRCAPDLSLPELLASPPEKALGYSLDTGPQGALAIFHTLKYIDRLCIYKLILYNSNPGMRLPPDTIAAIDKLVLAGYRTAANPMQSHLNFVYGHHVEAIFRQVETIFATAPEGMKCVARLIAMTHVHFGHLHMRADGSPDDVYHSDVSSNDCAQMAAYHGLAFTLPLIGQMLGNWRVDSLYWVTLRWAAFLQQALATDPDLAPIDLRSASDYTVEQFHQLVKNVLRGTKCGIDDLDRVDRHRFQKFLNEVTGIEGETYKSKQKQTEAYMNGVMACACIVCGLASASDVTASPADTEATAERAHIDQVAVHMQIDEELRVAADTAAGPHLPTEEEDDERVRREAADDQELDEGVHAAGEGSLTPYTTVMVNLQTHTASVKLLTERAGVSLQWTHAHHEIWGQPAVSATAFFEMITRGGMRWFGTQPDDNADNVTWAASALKAGRYAIIITEALADTENWDEFLLITIEGTTATVQLLVAEPTEPKTVLRITVLPSTLKTLQETEPCEAKNAVNRAMGSGNVWTAGKALLVTCICDLRPSLLCCKCAFVDSVALDDQDFDRPLERGEAPWKKKDGAADAISARLPFTVAAWHKCLSTVVDSSILFDAADFLSVHVRNQLSKQWGCMPNVDMFIPEKDTEMRMGRITTDWLYAQLDHHGLEVGAYKGRQRQYLVAELRKLRLKASVLPVPPVPPVPPPPTVPPPELALVFVDEESSTLDLADPATTVAAFVNAEDKLGFGEIDHANQSETHIMVKVLRALGETTCTITGERVGTDKSYVETWTRHHRNFTHLLVSRDDVLFGMAAVRLVITPRPWMIPGLKQSEAAQFLAAQFAVPE